MGYLKIILLSLLIIAGSVFAVSNHQYINIDLFPFPFKIEMPLFIVVFASIALGFILAWVKLNISIFSINRINHKQDAKIKALENEIEALKAEKFIN